MYQFLNLIILYNCLLLSHTISSILHSINVIKNSSSRFRVIPKSMLIVTLYEYIKRADSILVYSYEYIHTYIDAPKKFKHTDKLKQVTHYP